MGLTVKDFEMRVKNGDGSYDTLHPKTKIRNVIGLDEKMALKADKGTTNFFNVPKQSGWSGALTVGKNDMGLVALRGNLVSGTVASGTVIATVPKGYRPHSMSASPVAFNSYTGNTFIGILINSSNGEIRLRPSAVSSISKGEAINFNCVYYSGGVL